MDELGRGMGPPRLGVVSEGPRDDAAQASYND